MPPNSENSKVETPADEMDSKDSNKFIVKYRKHYYDISKFLRKHPGGVNTLKGLENADMTARFMRAPPHSDAAMYLMKEYQIETNVKSSKGDKRVKTEIKENLEIIEDSEADDKRNNNTLDESMEHLVDWSQAMLPQIPKISRHYNEWVHLPVDRKLRLFGPWYLEMCTKTPWWLVPAFWIPVISALVYSEFRQPIGNQEIFKTTVLSLYFLSGILFWTLLEYILHRFVFHMTLDENASSWLCTFHFLIHGLHHKVPFDPMRLVFPPLPAVIICLSLYAPLSLFVPKPRIFVSGALVGYLCYDLIHYYLHYGNPSLKQLYFLKRYHYQHHFVHQDQGYGVSNPLWDFVFDTKIRLRKLGFHLKWK